MSRRILRYVDQMPVMTMIDRNSQYRSNSSTTPATNIAPLDAKICGIQTGASSRTHVIRPGATSSRRSPTCRIGVALAGASAWVGDATELIIGRRNTALPRELDERLSHLK